LIMKRFFLLSLITALCSPHCADAQYNKPKTNKLQRQGIFTEIEKMPEFPGDLNKYLTQNIKYPPEARKNEVEGRVIVKFTIDTTGMVRNVIIAKSSDPVFNEEAARVIKNMPPWKPGIQNGKPVAVYYTMPVTFRL